jgi:hypothetical protein
MTKNEMDTQTLINAMHRGDNNAILNGISSPVPVVVLNAIIAGTQRNLRDTTFIDGVKKAGTSHETLLGIPVKSVAAASLHLLDVQEYSGNDSMVLAMIDSRLKT